MEISWEPPWRLRWSTIRITSMELRFWFRNIVTDILTLHELINTVVQWYERETSVIYSCYSCLCTFHMLSGMPWIWILFVLYMYLNWHVHWLFINITDIYIHARVSKTLYCVFWYSVLLVKGISHVYVNSDLGYIYLVIIYIERLHNRN